MMAGVLRFSGRVAIITGAGGGLGREYALMLAERGASIVVNDLGGSRSGEGHSSSAAADKVVKEIIDKGGKAVPDYNSVEEGEKIVKTAIDNYGRIDIVINNAGILRDKSFANMSEQDWDLIHRVHLKGSFSVTKAAWPYFRKQKFGRIIMTASGAGIYGNFGQANYSSAKLGILGLSNTLAIEGAKYGVQCNTIVPVAASRLTQDIMPPELLEQLKPNYVCPVVVWLCHESCLDTGGVYEAAGGWVGKYQWQRSMGKVFLPPSNLTAESVRDNWNSITDMEDGTTPSSLQEQMAVLVEALQGQNSAPTRKRRKVAEVDDDTCIYSEDTAILYAVAVGLTPKDQKWLPYLYEGSENFSVLPSFGTIAGMPAVFTSRALQDEIQKLNGDPSKILHGEQYLELYRPLPPAATLTSKCRLLDVLDKGSGAVLIVEEDTFDEKGEKIMYSQWTIFLVGAGNFGGKRSTNLAKTTLPPPQRPPDSYIEEKTPTSVTAIYRLCGDKNPIHIDPSFAAMGGFSEPIMHGLCSLGYATSHVIKQYANYDAKLFKSLMARFAKPMIPGNTIRTEMWNEGSRIHFESKCVETGQKVISGAYIDLVGSVSPQSSPNISNGPASELKSALVFARMAEQLKKHPDIAAKVKAVFQWDITKNGKTVATYTVDLKNGSGEIIEGLSPKEKPGCTLILEDDDLMAMTMGKLDPQKAFMSGKLKLKGNIMLTQKLKPLLAMKPDTAAATKGGGSDAPKLRSERMFMQLSEKLKKEPDLASSVHTIYQWNIQKDGKHVATWTLDLKNGSGSVYKGPPVGDKPDCTFILEDDLFVDMMEGKADPQRAFMSGKLKITGNVLASQKLHALWETPRDETEDYPEVQSKSSTSNVSQSSPQPLEPLSTVKSDFVFEIFAERLIEEPELAKKMKVVYNWNIMRGGKKLSEWTVDLKTGAGSIYRGPPKSGKADVTMTMEDEDVIQLMLGKLNPQRAFMTGRLKIKGNIMLTQKLNQLWQEILKSGRAVELPILSAILADKPFDPNLRSETCFVELGKRISRMPELVPKVNTIFEWNITKPGAESAKWTLDLKKPKGMLYRGPSQEGKATCVMTTDDDLFADWVLGRINGQQVLTSGKMQINGDKSIVSKLLDSFRPQSKL